MDAAENELLGTRAANLAALEERRRELRSKLRTVSASLRDAGAVTAGYDATYYLEAPPADAVAHQLFHRRLVRLSSEQLQREAALRLDVDPPDDTRVEWTLAALGRELCAAVFVRFDADEDGAWSFGEFLEYAAALERGREQPNVRAFASSAETWQMYTSDLFDTDAHSRLTFDGFVMYREAVEHASPLAADLRVLGVPIRWSGLERMKRCGALFDEYADAEGGVELKAAQFLFAESGRALLFRELCDAVQRQRVLARCHKHILNRKRALRLFGYRQRSDLLYTNPQLEEEPKICKPAFRSLMFSSWTPTPVTRWRHRFMELYLGSFTALRRWQRSASWAFKAVRQISRTGLLRASCLLSDPQRERGDYVVKLDVGTRFSPRATVHVSYNSDADSAATLHELKYLERGAECFVYVDLTCRSGTKENDALWISNKLTWLLREYFRDHLERLPFFHKWFVTLPSKLQLRSGPGMSAASGSGSSSASSPAVSATVIRIVVLFSGEMDLYQVMQSLRLPSSMQFDHMLQRFSLRASCSHSLEEVLTSKRLDFGSQWSCRAQLDARLNKQAWSQILAQLAKKLEADAEQEAGERAFLAEEKERKRQAELPHSHQPQQHQEHQQAPRKLQAFGDTDMPPESDADADEESAQQDEEQGLGEVRLWLERVAGVLGYSQEVSATVSFASVSDALFGNRWIASLLSPKLLRYVKHLAATPGGVASEWKSGCDVFRAEFASSHYAQGGGSSRTAGKPLSRASSRSSAQLGDDFSSLEHSIASAFPFATSEPLKRPLQSSGALPSSRPESSAGDARDTHSSERQRDPTADEARENELLELYDMCAKHLLGVSVVRAEAGTSGLSCVLEGWNLFSLLPRVKAQLAKRRSVARTKSSASTGSSSGAAASAGVGRSR